MSERLTLLPCPACQSKTEFYSEYGRHGAGCHKCGIGTRAAYSTEDRAAEVWNSLPRAMVWRKDIPDVKFYSNPDDIFFAEIEGTAVIIYASEMADTLEQPGLVNRWAGPIPTPKEPTP